MTIIGVASDNVITVDVHSLCRLRVQVDRRATGVQPKSFQYWDPHLEPKRIFKHPDSAGRHGAGDLSAKRGGERDALRPLASFLVGARSNSY